MKLLVPIAAGLLAALVSLPASARGVPPPPMVTPPALRQPIDGYDMRVPYELWRYWIEQRKGAVMNAALTKAEPPPGEQAIGATQLRFRAGWDMGQVMAGDAQVYCPPGSYGLARSPCHVVLRRVQIPDDVGGMGRPNALSRWMHENFDAPALARHLKAEGLGPDTDWWRADRKRMFSSFPSPDAALAAAVRLERVDSRDCPAMTQAFEALDKARVDIRLDMTGVGDDVAGKPPRPHSTAWTYTLSVRNDRGLTTLETDSWLIGDLVHPILEAADACLAKAAQQ